MRLGPHQGLEYKMASRSPLQDKPRTYRVWIKGQRLTTEQSISTQRGRLGALFLYANARGLKTIQCDAVWDRKAVG